MQPFGSTLRQERERRGISLEDISSSTKIRLLYLRAIEQDHLDELPGGLIGRGFVRAYARAIGIDEEETIAVYQANRAETESQLTPQPPLQAPRRHFNIATRLPAWAFVAGFLAIGAGFTILGELRNHYPFFRVSGTESASTNSSPTPSQTTQAEATPSDQPLTNQKTVTTRVSADRQEQDGNAAIPASALTPESDALNLVLNVRQDAWLSIIADGHRIFSDTLVAPAERVVKAHSQILVRVGNSGAVDFTFNGENLPAQGGYGEARTLRFDVHGLMPPIPRPDPPAPSTVSPAPANPNDPANPNAVL